MTRASATLKQLEAAYDWPTWFDKGLSDIELAKTLSLRRWQIAMMRNHVNTQLRPVADNADICRDDHCAVLDIHKAHAVRYNFAPYVPQPKRDRARLEQCVVSVLNARRAKLFAEIARDVKDAGIAVDTRCLFRVLSRLCETSRIARISMPSLFGKFGAYVSAGSPLLQDSYAVYEQLSDLRDGRTL